MYDKIENLSRFYRIFFQICFYLIPIAILYYWLTFYPTNSGNSGNWMLDVGIGADFLSYIKTDSITLVTKLLAFISSMLPAGVVMYGLRQLIVLFRSYEKGDIFTLKNTRCYQALGYTLFAWVIAGVIYSGLISVILSYHNPTGERVLSLTLSGIDIVALITGFVIILISRVMRIAQVVSEEQELTI